MTLDLFLRGLSIGFAVAFALGPIGLLVIRRTVDRGWAYGFLSGVGVATADAMYGAIAAFGLTAVSTVLVGIDQALGIVGGVVLVILAVRSLRSTRRSADGVTARADGITPGGPIAAWATMVALTATNPATILSFAALFASIGAGTGGPAGAMSVVVGVFLGSVAWWAILTGVIAGLRARLTPRVIQWLNTVSAVVIGGFGVIAIWIGVTG
ncbi:MAG TPA: LysE family transporter [Candidatus Limnocylindrales bacterium]|nr:LysE family transporter [Candidatus Limnocylindrales bacterium]